MPSGATVQSVTLTHAYRPNSASRQLCYRLETFAGATAIGTHGNTTTGYSCNPSTTTDVVDANSLSARFHMWRSSAGTTLSRTNQVLLSVTYIK